MTPRKAARIATIITGIAVAVLMAMLALAGGRDAPDANDIAGVLILLTGVCAVSLLGATIIRRTGNAIGWIFVALPIATACSFATEAYVIAAYRPPTDLPGVTLAAWLTGIATTAIALPITLLLLLFPTGRPLSPRWRWVVRAWAAGSTLVLAWTAVRPGGYGTPSGGGYPSIHVDNPIAFAGPPIVLTVIVNVGVALLLATAALGIACLVLRFRRADREERQQLRWLALVALAGGSLVLIQIALDIAGVDASWLTDPLWWATVVVLLLGLPAAVAIAVLKYRLYDVDVVIRKTVVYASVAAFITVVYVGLVVGLGSLLGGGERPNVALQIAATAIVAIMFQPVRDRANRLANRIVYGRRATPYETLARFSERVGGTYAVEDVLARVVHVIAEGVAAARIDVWLRVGDALLPAATWPGDAVPRDAVQLDGDALPALAGDRAVPVVLGSSLLGAITAEKPANEPFTAGEERLLEDLAGQAGLLLSNARMTAELEADLARIDAQARELRASRQRIVAAQDQERRRLERNIHDGAQQHLVALAVKLRLARSTVTKDPARARGLLDALGDEIDDALDTLTSLALGIYPPLLERQGLGPALADQYTRSDLPVRLSTDGTARYPLEVEGAVYFCVLEALQNAAKHARASRIDVSLEERQGQLRFEVRDDGAGFEIGDGAGGTGLAGMRDRLSVFGGDATVESAPGRGTVVRGWLPLREGALAVR